MKSASKRVIKTQNLITSVFISLLKENGFAKTTVNDIIRESQINRSTFYAHYLDKYDLLDKTEEMLLRGLREIEDRTPLENLSLSSIITDSSSGDWLSHTKQYINYMYERGELFMLFTLDDATGPMFASKVNKSIQVLWSERKLLDKLLIPENYAYAMLINMSNGLVFEWVKSGFHETPEEFLSIYTRTLTSVLRTILEISQDD